MAADIFKPKAVTPEPWQSDGESVPPAKFPVKKLLLILGIVATLYAAVVLVWGSKPNVSFFRLWSLTGLQAAALCILNYGLRGLRWRFWMAHYGRKFGLLQGLRLYLAGYAFTPTPGNVGEAVRGLMLTRNPLGTAQSLAIFGAERLADLLCLMLLCLPVVWWALVDGTMRVAPAWVVAGLVFILIFGLLVVGVLVRFRARLMQRLTWLQEAWHCLTARPWIWFTLTIVAWLAQGLAVWLICRDFGLNLSVLTAMGFYAVAMVAGALSALPAGLGGMEVVLTGLLVSHGAAGGQALTITVLVRLLTLWLAVVIGLMALLYSAAIRKEISFR